MNQKQKDLIERLMPTFRAETEEHLEVISANLISLEHAAPGSAKENLIESILREAHSMKGASRAVGIYSIELIFQTLESLMVAFKLSDVTVPATIFDDLHQTVQLVTRLVDNPTDLRADVEQYVNKLKKYSNAFNGSAAPAKQVRKKRTLRSKAAQKIPAAKMSAAIEADKSGIKSKNRPGFQSQSESTAVTDDKIDIQPGETLKVSSEKILSFLRQNEELLTVKLLAGQWQDDIRSLEDELNRWKKNWERDFSDLFDSMIRYNGNGEAESGQSDYVHGISHRIQGFFDRNSEYFNSIQLNTSQVKNNAVLNLRHITGTINNLSDATRKLVMIPFSDLLKSLPRMTRNMLKQQGKEADLEISGAEIEVDRRIIETMMPPLIHLVRNCIDHGLEKPKTRREKGKPVRGKLVISLSQQEGGKFELKISDDGQGIDKKRVAAAALSRGLITKTGAKELSPQLVKELIFSSGLSTTPIITDISGRGLGLAIVKEKVEQLAGKIFVETCENAGTTFRILLPLSMATFKGVLVSANQQMFVIPTRHLVKVIRINKDLIRSIENRETLQFQGKALWLVRLADILGIQNSESAAEGSDQLQVLILNSGDERLAVAVDEVIAEQEVMVKNLGKQIRRLPNILAATVMGSGKVALILNVNDFIKSSTAIKGSLVSASDEEPKKGDLTRSILLAEDSITSRMLLKNILESAGFRVRLAVDGLDALSKLKSEPFDLVVTDVDMPRMSGFELTAKIRKSKQLSDMPVVIVTSLESHEDREQGIDVGANAYIIKSSFDQTNLLDVIEKLL